MKLSLLGTGAVGGVPLYGCDCPACSQARSRPELVRRPASAVYETGGVRLALDAGRVDFGQKFPNGSLDALLLTHYHMDHVAGLFDIRWGKGAKLPVHGPRDTQGCADLFQHPGLLDFCPVLEPFASREWEDTRVTALPLIHSKPTLGYFIKYQRSCIAYLTDTAGLPAETHAFLTAHRPDLMILDCTHPPRDTPPRGHNDVDLACELHRSIQPGETWLTHIGHDLDAWLMAHPDALPGGIKVAHDGWVWQSEP
ncbi:phosphonate metabolism protein PhnP [Guyparkeria sp. 1SP6A2]|nr:phosphonate metabolism protein PhnP [Guyparkeria sp. 1SP6A2]